MIVKPEHASNWHPLADLLKEAQKWVDDKSPRGDT